MPKCKNAKRRLEIQQMKTMSAISPAESPIAIDIEVSSLVDTEALQREVMELRRRNSELIASTNRQSSDSTQTAFFLGIDNSWNERQPGISLPRLTNGGK